MATKQKKKPVYKLVFLDNLNIFQTHLEGFSNSLFTVGLLAMINKKNREKLDKFIESKGKKVKKEGGDIHYKIQPKDYLEHKRLINDITKYEIGIKILTRGLFITMVSQFDTFLASIVKIILDIQPNIISPEKSLTFRDIKGFKTIKNAIDYLIEKEIDALLFDSHAEHLKWLGDKTGIDIDKHFKEEWLTFIELTERRNLFTHNDGIINERYLYKCKIEGIPINPSWKKGTALHISPEYFQTTSNCLYKISVKLTYLLWKKFKPQEIKFIDNKFNNMAVELIKNKKYPLAEEMMHFIKLNSTESTDELKRFFAINFALAKKMSGKKEEAINFIKEMDWTSCHNEFRLAVEILKDNYDEAYIFMKKIGKKSELIDEESYKSDPLYSEIIKQDKFSKVYKDIFKKKFLPEKKVEKGKLKFKIEY